MSEEPSKKEIPPLAERLYVSEEGVLCVNQVLGATTYIRLVSGSIGFIVQTKSVRANILIVLHENQYYVLDLSYE